LRLTKSVTAFHSQQRSQFAPAPFSRELTSGAPDAAGDGAYRRLSPIYDLVFGAPLQPGRAAAIRRMAIGPGDRILEIGAGTGLNFPLYPQDCHVTAIDLSGPMLERAQARIEQARISHIELLEQDAADMRFANDAFDSVYAPYVMSAVADPIRVAREMQRVCRPGGRIVILNHFRSTNPLVSRLEATLSPLTVHVGFRLDLDLGRVLEQAHLRPASIEKVNLPPMWSLVTCLKD
jgi:phosphatidylethanolamine/phosphatidyl-N-methylethanolamine N-methyltransferase